MPIERRKYPRFKIVIPAVIHHPYNEHAETADISLGGVAIYNIQKYYNTEETVGLELILGEESGSVFCNARVASIYPNTKDAEIYKLHLEFLDMSDEDKKKLKDWITASGATPDEGSDRIE
ncbi:MAG: PilZ domain-containing protein [Candidatus Omnitrophota bacterium]